MGNRNGLVCLLIHPSFHPSTLPFVPPSICLSGYLLTCMSTCLSLCLPTCLSIYLSVSLFVCLSASSFSQSFPQSIHLFVFLSLYHVTGQFFLPSILTLVSPSTHPFLLECLYICAIYPYALLFVCPSVRLSLYPLFNHSFIESIRSSPARPLNHPWGCPSIYVLIPSSALVWFRPSNCPSLRLCVSPSPFMRCQSKKTSLNDSWQK